MDTYEKKYNEALERAKELLLGNEHSNTIRSYFEHIFPELRESEDFDEKVRKWLVGYFSSIKDTVWINRNTITCEQILSWLEEQKDKNCLACDQHLKGYIAGRKVTEEEKQKEPKPPVDVDPCDASCDAYYQRGLNKGYELGLEAGRKEQKPVEWSEEDEKMKERLITRLNWITYNTRTDGTSPNITFFDEIDWLKSLRPGWKPTEEQMEALNYAIAERDGGKRLEGLYALRTDLKKLI